MASGASHSQPFRLSDLATALHGLACIATVLWVNAIRHHGNAVAVPFRSNSIPHTFTQTHPLL